MAMLFGPQNIARAFGVRTLARIPMAGGARRDVLTGVVDADWIPGTDALAVIRDPGGGRPWTVEFPVGTTVHEARAAWSLRVSPDGNRVAFFEGPVLFGGAPDAMVTVIDKTGHTSTLSRNLAGIGLAWAPSGSEVWFTAARPAQQSRRPATACRLALGSRAHRVQRARLGRVTRHLHRMAGSCCPETLFGSTLPVRPRGIDVSAIWDGRWRRRANGLSPDGRTLIFSDDLSGGTPAGNATVFRRSTEGSPAVSLGEARGGGALSPDGQWVLAEVDGNRILLPTGAGSMCEVAEGRLGAVRRRRVAQRLEAHRLHGRPWRRETQRLHPGDPRRSAARDYSCWGLFRRREPPCATTTPSSVASVTRGRSFRFMAASPQPVPALKPGDIPLQWSHDGRYLYAVDNRRGCQVASR